MQSRATTTRGGRVKCGQASQWRPSVRRCVRAVPPKTQASSGNSNNSAKANHRAGRSADRVVISLLPLSLLLANANFAAAAEDVSPLSTAVTPISTPAVNLPAVDVDGAVNVAIGAVKATGQFVKDGFKFLASGVQTVKEGVDAATPYVKQAVDTVTPTVTSAVKTIQDVADPAFKQAAPVVQSTVQDALRSSGVDINAVTSQSTVYTQKAQQSVGIVTPYLTKAWRFVTTTEPVLLAEYAAGGAAVYYLGPPLLKFLFGSLRGYAGEVTAATTLDWISQDGNSVLVDIRTEKEKDSSGVPDVPSSGKLVEVEFAYTEDRRLRGQLRNANGVETQVTALQVAALKRIGRGTRVILLDKYGPLARSIAKELYRRGFKRVYTVAGGFDGRNGWVQSKLQIKPALTDFSSTFSLPGTRSRRALPAPR